MVFVIGATGKVGRHVVSGLKERGAAVRALVRDPGTAGLPAGVELVRGDLSDPASLDEDADAAFLVWPFMRDSGAAEAVRVLARRARRIVGLMNQRASRPSVGHRTTPVSRICGAHIADAAVRVLTEDGPDGAGRVPETALDTWASFVDEPETVTPAVG